MAVLPRLAESYTEATLADRLRTAPTESAALLDGYLSEEASRLTLKAHQIRLVLVVDQLEECWGPSMSEIERRALAACLAAMAREGRIWVIATLRSDFIPHLEASSEYMALLRDGQLYMLSTPRPDELAQMIRAPAEAAGLAWEVKEGVSLDQAVLREATSSPESLPLLEYALDQLYEHREGRTLTYAAYENLGRLAGGIAASAEAVLNEQGPPAEHALPRLLRSLVSADESGQATRRYAPLGEFGESTPERSLLDRLIGRRLCVADKLADRAVVCLAHDSLLRSWPRLTDWLQQEQSLLQTRDLVERETRLWQQHGESDAWLAAADKLPAFQALSSAEIVLPASAGDFLARSARRARLNVRIKQIAVVLIASLAVAASVGAWVATKRQREAEHQTALSLQAQMRSLTEAAAGRLRDGELAYARGVMIEVLKRSGHQNLPDASAVNVFQEIRAADPMAVILAGHTGPIRNIAYSPDGTRLVTASGDRTARIWDARTGIQLSVLQRQDRHWIMDAAYSRDGTRIVTSGGGTVHIYDARSGHQLLALSDPGEDVDSGSFSPDGTRIVTSFDKTARIWDAHTGAALMTLPKQDSEIYFTTYSPDGTRILTLQANRTARILDARTGKPVVVLAGLSDEGVQASYSPDGSRIVTGSTNGAVRVWNAATGAQLLQLPLNVSQVWSVAFSPNGKMIATATVDKKVRVWDAKTGTVIKVFSGHEEIVCGVAFSPDGLHLASAAYDKTARIWDLQAGEDAVVFGNGDSVIDAEYTRAGARVITSSADKTARIWDIGQATLLATLSNPSDGFECARYSHDGTRIATVGTRAIRVWDAGTGVPLRVLPGPDVIGCPSFSPNDQRIAATFEDTSFGIWDTGTGASLVIRAGHRNYVNSIRYSPDGTRILTASVDKTARIWDAQSGKQLAIFQHGDYLQAGAYSPDGARIVTAGNDKAARVWDARNGAQLLTLLGHHTYVDDVSFSPDGSRIVTASWDKTVRIWDARTGLQLAVLSGHTEAVTSAVYSVDGAHIMSTSDDKTVRFWDARVPASLQVQIMWAQAAESDPLSEVETKQLGLALENRTVTFLGGASACDQAAAAYYDPDRRAAGVEQADINADFAKSVCVRNTGAEQESIRRTFQEGRALLANDEFEGARGLFERAVARGYRAARVDLAGLLINPAAKRLDPVRAVTLYEQAWRDGVPIAAYRLGQLYELGVQGTSSVAPVSFSSDAERAWLWYQKGADTNEPHALARLAAREESRALSVKIMKDSNALLLGAFQLYARAVELARQADWPDSVLRDWRFRRASLARLLARAGLMQEVAGTYQNISAKGAWPKPTFVQSNAVSTTTRPQ